MLKPRDGVDEYYTPDRVAESLASALPSSLKGAVLDPAVGGGALLDAVEARFGTSISPIGLDVSAEATRHLRLMRPSWTVSRADALNPVSRASSRAWRMATQTDLAAVVMNPPFSYRGNGGHVVEYGGFRGRVAPSVHFLVEVLHALEPREGIFAILPDGAIRAERHTRLWEQISSNYQVEVLDRPSDSSFHGARVSTSIVHIHRRMSSNVGESSPTFSLPLQHPVGQSACRCVEIVRGRVPIHSLASFSGEEAVAPLFHTTDLLLGSVARTAPERLADAAPLILFSRVGKWRTPRLIELGRVVLSDCLFGVRPRNLSSIDTLRKQLDSISSALESRLRGTGAPYLTLRDMTEVLRTSGWDPHVVKAGSEIGRCGCGATTGPAANAARFAGPGGQPMLPLLRLER